MALTRKSEWIFLWLSPIPFIVTIVIPVALNVYFDFSPDVRASIVLISKIGLALSAVFVLSGLCVLLRDRRVERRANRPMLALATLLAGFPAALFLVTFSVSWVIYFIL